MGTLAPFLFLLQANATGKSTEPPVVYSTGSLILVGVVLVVLGLLLFVMVYYSNRIAQTVPPGGASKGRVLHHKTGANPEVTMREVGQG
jgi:hypothetical protein